MKWRAFEFNGTTYDLKHLDPVTLRFERSLQGDKPPEVHKVDVFFTSHCFTCKPKPDQSYDEKLVYPDDYEKRLFDFRRYELSKGLPAIIRNLPDRKPRQNDGEQRFFTVEIIDEDQHKIEYDVFFKVRKAGKGKLEMIVESAFVRDPEHQSSRPKGRPISFWIILHNTLHGRKIRK